MSNSHPNINESSSQWQLGLTPFTEKKVKLGSISAFQ